MGVREESKDHRQKLCSRDIEEVWEVSGRGREDKAERILETPKPGKCFCVDSGTCFIGDKTQVCFQPVFDEFNSELVALVGGISCDHTLTLKALEELCRLYPKKAFLIRSDGGNELDNNDVKDFFKKKGISWIMVSRPWDNPFAERGIRTIKHEYLNLVWIGNFDEFEELAKIIKSHYNKCRPHQSFDNKTPAEVRIATTGNSQEYSPPESWRNGVLSIGPYGVEQKRQYVNGHYI